MSEDTCHAASISCFQTNPDPFFDDESTLFKDLINEQNAIHLISDKSLCAFENDPPRKDIILVPVPPPPPPPPPPRKLSSKPSTTNSSSPLNSTKTPVRTTNKIAQTFTQSSTTSTTTTAPIPFQLSDKKQQPMKRPVALVKSSPSAAAAAVAAPKTKSTKPAVATTTSPVVAAAAAQQQDSKKKKALQSSLSAYLHLHMPHMTPSEQQALILTYHGREFDLWQMLNIRFGEGSVPARLLQAGGGNGEQDALRGSTKIQLAPRHSNEEVQHAMRRHGLELEVKETILRTTTVSALVRDLSFRWLCVDEEFRMKNYTLCLYSPGSQQCLHAGEVVRECILDGMLEYGWQRDEVKDEPPEVDFSLHQENSLLGGGSSAAAATSYSPKRPRRIQPEQV